MKIKTALLALFISALCTSTVFARKHIPLSYLNMDGIHVAPTGLIYAAGGFSGDTVYVITQDGNTFDYASGLNGPIDITNDSHGNLYVTNFNDGTVSKIAPDQTVSKFADVLPGPGGIVADEEDNLYVAHYGTGGGNGDTVLKITPAGEVSVFAQGGNLLAPVGIDIDDEGNLFTANFNEGSIVKITPDGAQEVLAQIQSDAGFAIGHLAYVDGLIYATGPAGQTLYIVKPNGRVRARSRNVNEGQFPNGITYDPTTHSILFTYVFSSVSALEKITLRKRD